MCVVGSIIESLDKEDADALIDAIEQLSNGSAPFSTSWLHRILISEGHRLGNATLLRHVTKGCVCATK
jgi:hypothetical protein